MDGTAVNLFLADLPTWGGKLGPKLHPGGGFFGPWFLIILKNSHQDLSNEGSNFVLSLLEVGHWVAQTFFDKLPEITDFGLSEFAKFWSRACVRIDHAFTFGMLKNVFS